MSKWEDVKNLVDKTVEHYGRLDVLICNAGIKFEDSFRRTSHEILQKIMQVNFMGKVLPIKAALEALDRKPGKHYPYW